MQIGDMIKSIRKSKKAPKITQEDLAKKCGVWQSFITQIETNKKKPTPKMTVKIAKALGENPDELLKVLANEKVFLPSGSTSRLDVKFEYKKPSE